LDPKSVPPPTIYDFGPFRLDELDGRLWRHDQPQSLRPKAFAILAYLAARAGRLIEKSELLAALWPEVTVEEAALTVCVHELRRVLGDDRRQPRFIETRYRRGYRFIAPVIAVSTTKKAGKRSRKAIPSTLLDSMPPVEGNVGSCGDSAAPTRVSAKVP
jgi:DNA-binding winged helix-turn-helix (wHTH) protein